MDTQSWRFSGVATASDVVAAHAEPEFPDFAGALAASKHGCQTSEDFTYFIVGAATRAPPEDPVPAHRHHRGRDDVHW